MTLAELIADFRLRTGDINQEYLFSDAQVTSYANLAETEAAIRAKLLYDNADVTLVADQADYTLNAKIISIDSAVLTTLPIYDGDELITSAGWTVTAGWTESPDDTFTHTSGITTLSHSATVVSGTKYRLSWTVTGRTAGSFTVAIGGQSQATNTATGTLDITASNTSALVITPTTDFDGVISLVSAKALTTESVKTVLNQTDRITMAKEYPLWRTTSASKPTHILVEDNAYELYPTPDTAYTLTLYYYRTPLTAMSLTTHTPEIAVKHHDGLTDWMVRCALLVKDIDTESLTLSTDSEAKFMRRFGIRDDANVTRKKARKGAHTTRSIGF